MKIEIWWLVEVLEDQVLINIWYSIIQYSILFANLGFKDL